jgi:hypothetical protein
MAIPKRLSLSGGIGVATFLLLWLLVTIINRGSVDILGHNDFCLAIDYCWLWPHFVIYPLRSVFHYHWMYWAAFVVIDVAVYATIALCVLSFAARPKRKPYYEE